MNLPRESEQYLHLYFVELIVSECSGEERAEKTFQKGLTVSGIDYVVDADLKIQYDTEKERYLVSCYEYKASLLNDLSCDFVDLDRLELEKDLEYKLDYNN